MKFSIVIPTHKRPEILQRCLQALELQDFPREEFEVVVINDGGDEKTREIIENFLKNSRFPLRDFTQPHQGQGVARNLGVKEAHGDIVIFIGDDIFVTQDFLKEHHKRHSEHPYDNEAALGLVEWHPDLAITPLMDFMTKGGAVFGRFGGHQFAYDLLEGKDEADYRFFYTANISLKRRLLLDNPFDPWFSGYGWEDIELGYRLSKRANLRIFYNPKASGYHYHSMSPQDFEKRMRAIGESTWRIHQKYPELGRVPGLKKRAIFRMLSNPLSLRLLKFSPNLYYYALSKKYFLDGLRAGK